MFLTLVAVTLSCLAAWLLLKWWKLRNFWADRGVPYDPPHPILGSLTFLQKENPGLWMRRMFKRFPVPYCGVWLFWRPALIVNDPQLARRILVKDADVFRNRYLGSGKTDPIGALNLFTVDDPLWTSLRRRLTPVFTSAKLRSLEELVRGKAADLVTRIEEELRKNQLTNLRVVCTDYTTDVIGESAFGIKSDSTLTGDSVVRKVTRDFMHFSVFRGLGWSSIFFFPALVDIFGFSFYPKDTIAYLRKLMNMIVEQRGGYDHPVKEPRDLLDALLKMRQDAAKENEVVSEDLILSQAAIFLHGGFETSGGILTMTIYELAQQPEMQELLYKELKEALQKNGNKELESAQLSELPYLNAVMKETLRKWPPMGWMDRVALRDYKLDELTLPAGTVVYVNAVGAHWNEEYFPEPEVFRPERFLGDAQDDIQPYTYLPFGEGPRHCIGMKVAHQTLRLGLAAVFLKYTVSPAPGFPLPNDVQIEKRGMLLQPGEDLSVIFTPRA